MPIEPRAMKIDRIALFSTDHPFYVDMLFGLARGFESIGVDTNVMTQLPRTETLNSFCRQYRPSAVLEINRSRSELPRFPEEIPHICWFQDYNEGRNREPSASDITYYLTDPHSLGFPVNESRLSGYLLPGVDETRYFYGERERQSDLSFIGYIPQPIPKSVLDTAFIDIEALGRSLTHREIFDVIIDRVNRPDYINLEVPEIRELVYSETARRLGIQREHLPGFPPEIMDWFDRRLLRMHDRRRLLKSALNVSESMRIYGTIEWREWPEFARYYRGYLSNQDDIRAVFQTTGINLHNNPNGFGMHFRVLECMASGGCIMVNRGRSDDDEAGINAFFEPGVHYVPYTFNDCEAVCREHLPDTERARRIGREASRLVHAEHTWTHRARQIVGDLAQR